MDAVTCKPCSLAACWALDPQQPVDDDPHHSPAREPRPAYVHIGRHPATGSPRYPYLVFHVERSDHVDVWRVLQGQRDIPAWMQDPERNLSLAPLRWGSGWALGPRGSIRRSSWPLMLRRPAGSGMVQQVVCAVRSAAKEVSRVSMFQVGTAAHGHADLFR